jgi:hypothetical protein
VRFRFIQQKEKSMSVSTMDRYSGPLGRSGWGRKDEEYCADFCLIAKRVLPPVEYGVFRFHFLLGADWRLCTKRLGMDRGQFFHSVYRLENQLGRVFRELQPYGLYPLDEYFGTGMRDVARLIVPALVEFPRPRRFDPPLRRVA